MDFPDRLDIYPKSTQARSPMEIVRASTAVSTEVTTLWG